MHGSPMLGSWNSDEEFLRYLNGLPPKKESPDFNHMKISA